MHAGINTAFPFLGMQLRILLLTKQLTGQKAFAYQSTTAKTDQHF